MKKICILAALIAASTLAAAAPAAPIEGVVSKVVDGDTLWFTAAGKPPLVVRLRDIDAPEICQPWGDQAQRALTELALNKTATLRIAARDAHGRTLGSVFVDAVDLGQLLVAEGHAWSTRTRYDQGPLVKQERMAKALGRGLHTLGGNVAPWDFRAAHGSCAASDSAIAARPAPVTAPSLASQPPMATSRPVPAVDRQTATPHARCDGRTRCTQMTSCGEARYFLANCPGVQMDGDGDGIPCESQWCSQDVESRSARGRRK